MSDIPRIPEYCQPAYYTVDGEFESGESSNHMIEFRRDPAAPKETVNIKIDDQTFDVLVVSLGNVSAKGLWTAVHYLRDYGAHGVWKERLNFNGYQWRLGAFYCIGPFELTERETNYPKYGEFPYES